MIAALRAVLAARARRIAAEAVADAAEELATRIVAEVPEIGIEIGESEVRISAPGLWQRVFGSRKRAADSRLRGLIGGGQ